MYSIEDKIRSRFFIWCGVRIIALILMIIYLVLLCKNFFNNDINRGNNCKWCKYFNCIPVKGWCDIGQVSVTSTTTTSDSNSNSNPTTTASSSSSSVPTTRYSTMTYTTSMPSSVENPKSNTNSEGTNGGLRKDLPVVLLVVIVVVQLISLHVLVVIFNNNMELVVDYM